MSQTDKSACWRQVRKPEEDDGIRGAKIKTGLRSGMPQSRCQVVQPESTTVERLCTIYHSLWVTELLQKLLAWC